MVKYVPPAKNKPCPCGSGKLYKRCCLLTGKQVPDKLPSNLTFNKKYNRFESPIDHQYMQFNYADCKYIDSKPYRAKIKCRLMHTAGNTVVLPDFIFLKNGWIQPLQFTASHIVKVDETKILCNFFIDIQNGETVMVRFYNNDLLQTFSDKSQLYDCEIYAPQDIEEYACGEYEVVNNKIYIKLFHHTNEAGYNGIMASKSLRSSRWNYKGNKECENFHFAYFTHIPEIKFSSDLITVAMSADGNIDYMIDSFQQPAIVSPDFRAQYEASIYTAKVYRSTTTDRKHPITFKVPVESIDVKHVYFHTQGNMSFYEICFPYIHRLKLVANSSLPFDADYRIENVPPIVTSQYLIVGDARVKSGLAAPFEEEETKYIFKIEDCGNQSLQDFWFNNANKDLFTGKSVETMSMKEVDVNPTK